MSWYDDAREGITMRPMWKDLLTAVVMGLILPGILMNFAVMLLDRPSESLPQVPPAFQETIPETVSIPMYLRTSGGAVQEMDLNTYLVGVVLAEMPASFEMEALKAQAVAARTYTRKAAQTGGKHGDGSVCSRSACCQAYIASEEYLAKGGTQENLDKVYTAVTETSGYVLTYEGELIEATYFSSSGGWTEDAAAVWGTDYPYLQSVASPGEEAAGYDVDTVTYTSRQFQNALGVILEGSPYAWFGAMERTEGGGVASVEIGGIVYTGAQLRSLLGLRSTAFTVQTGQEEIIITTRGYGHRVGMSQYGADAMAMQGSTFREILQHYYQDTELTYLE